MKWSIIAVTIPSFTVTNLWYLIVDNQKVAKLFYFQGKLFCTKQHGIGLYQLPIPLSNYHLRKAIKRLDNDRLQKSYSRHITSADHRLESDVPNVVGIGANIR